MQEKQKISISAATFSGNQGGASMLHATIQQINKLNPSSAISVFTVYPKEDKVLNPYDNVEVYPANPKHLVVSLIPGTFAYRFLPFTRKIVSKVSGIEQVVNSDFHIDLAGISFADGRRKFLIYNICSILPSLISKVPVVKLSQALGPFNDSINKLVSKPVLKKLKVIFARGTKTRQGLDKMGLKNVQDASDIAFLFEPDKQGIESAQSFLNEHSLLDKNFVTFSPSSVLYKKAEQLGIDYVGETAKVIDSLLVESDMPIVILPHAIRTNPEKLHNNDVPIVTNIYNQLKTKDNVYFAKDELYASGIKTVLSKSLLVVAARFHAMIGALSTNTPVVVTGWSHKYQEVLDSFQIDMPVVYLDSDYQQNTLKQTLIALEQIKQLEAQIASKLPEIKASSFKQIEFIDSNF